MHYNQFSICFLCLFALVVSPVLAQNRPFNNVSTRGFIGTGDNVLIGGFIIGGSEPQTVVVRAIGPSLANFNVTGVLDDPKLELFSGQTLLMMNDNWQDGMDVDTIIDEGLAPIDPQESALLALLAPGPYTAIVRGMNGATGIGLIEAFGLSEQVLLAQNFSQATMCAEEDNVSVPLLAPEGVNELDIVATHPQYDFSDDSCLPNFDNCNIDSSDDFTFVPETRTLFDNGEIVIQGVREQQWFLPNTMAVSVTGGLALDSHFVRLIRRIQGTSFFPEVMVINMDGNLRLKPHAPVGKSNNDTCFGSSVLIGPADPNSVRPVAEIATLVYEPDEDRFDITYRDGSSASLNVQTVNRSQMSIRVEIGYPVSAEEPAAIFRSMFVADGNADVDRIQGSSAAVGILDFIEDSAPSFMFFRATRSIHNTSAPDIEIRTQ